MPDAFFAIVLVLAGGALAIGLQTLGARRERSRWVADDGPRGPVGLARFRRPPPSVAPSTDAPPPDAPPPDAPLPDAPLPDAGSPPVALGAGASFDPTPPGAESSVTGREALVEAVPVLPLPAEAEGSPPIEGDAVDLREAAVDDAGPPPARGTGTVALTSMYDLGPADGYDATVVGGAEPLPDEPWTTPAGAPAGGPRQVAVRVDAFVGTVEVPVEVDGEAIVFGSAAEADVWVAGEPLQVAIVFSDDVAMVSRLGDHPARLGSVDLGPVAVPITTQARDLVLAHALIDLTEFVPQPPARSLLVNWEVEGGTGTDISSAALPGCSALVAGVGSASMAERVAAAFCGRGERAAVWALEAGRGSAEPITACSIGATVVDDRIRVVVASSSGRLRLWVSDFDGVEHERHVAPDRDGLSTAALPDSGRFRIGLESADGGVRVSARVEVRRTDAMVGPDRR